jgi:hypothetical protein
MREGQLCCFKMYMWCENSPSCLNVSKRNVEPVNVLLTFHMQTTYYIGISLVSLILGWGKAQISNLIITGSINPSRHL